MGGSPGRCEDLDRDTELADHRAALAALLRRPDVDPSRVVVFGGSMGGANAPLLAANRDLAGVIVWGAGAWTWAERMLRFERNALELGGTPPERIAARDPELGRAWTRIVGAGEGTHYGRPVRFHHQAQRADWAAAWARVRAPVLVLHGQMDWFEAAHSAELIARIVNARTPGRATFVEVPGLDHHFSAYPTREAAFREEGGRVDPDLAVEIILGWLGRLLGHSWARSAGRGTPSSGSAETARVRATPGPGRSRPRSGSSSSGRGGSRAGA